MKMKWIPKMAAFRGRNCITGWSERGWGVTCPPEKQCKFNCTNAIGMQCWNNTHSHKTPVQTELILHRCIMRERLKGRDCGDDEAKWYIMNGGPLLYIYKPKVHVIYKVTNLLHIITSGNIHVQHLYWMEQLFLYVYMHRMRDLMHNCAYGCERA